MEEEDCLDLNVLRYRGEGNNCIVLANPKHGNIYRFRKSSEASDQEVYKKTKSVTKDLAITNLFREVVMVDLLGSRFVPEMKLLEVDSELLKQVDDKFYDCRPEYRQRKHVDESYSQILQAPDATLLPPNLRKFANGPTMSIEIKPKQGFVPYRPSRNGDLAAQTCRFCLTQYHPSKLAMKNRVSSYCPCDLFSGDRKRMYEALDSLVKVPLLNLRVFKQILPKRQNCNNSKEYEDGSIILNHEKDTLEDELLVFMNATKNNNNNCLGDFINLIIDALLHDFSPSSKQSVISSSRPMNQSCAWHCHKNNLPRLPPSKTIALPKESILGRILSAQLLGADDIEDLKSPYQRVTAFLDENDLKWEWSLTANDIRHAFNSNLRDISTGELDQLIENFKTIEDYLISAVARDLSLIIALEAASPNCPSDVPLLISANNEKFVFNITVVDLDPKPFSKIKEYFKLDNDLVEAFQNHIQTLSNN